MNQRKRTDPSPAERKMLDEWISGVLNPRVFHYGSNRRSVARYDKREKMYGGSGTVFLMQLFHPGELANNRIGAFMILPTASDSIGYHTHGTRKEEELYVILSGKGEYLEKDNWDSPERVFPVEAGSVTTVRGDAFHGIRNTGDDPLILFVITTNEPA